MTCEAVKFDAVGDRYAEFIVTKRVVIDELNCTLVELEHEPTGAQIMHIANDDPENVFSLSFRTLPETSDGVAHILEHTVLCGSEKFPVRDPFFSMTRRSLNTFMNAMTGSDFTCYPAASQVEKDFYNLLEVYFDAVFKPQLTELSFSQEGHRLEFVKGKDGNSELQYKGIVFNEMKGVYASPDSRLWKLLREDLFPDITYGKDSGGDPKVIPELSYQGLLDFHSKYYDPSRCLFFFYGNLPLEKHLDFTKKHVLNGAKKLPPLPMIPLQKRLSKPTFRREKYPIAEDKDLKGQTIVASAFLTCHILEQSELLALSVLEILMMGNDSSPLKLALLRSGLCTQASSCLEEDISEVPFILFLKGCNSEDAEKLRDLIITSLKAIAESSFEKDRVEAAIHQIEIYRTEITGDSYPYGLSLYMRSALLSQHGGDAVDSLKVHSLFDTLREQIKDANFFPNLIKKHFINNPHFVTVAIDPDKNLAKEEEADEKARLKALSKTLSEKDKKEIVKRAEELEALQEDQENQNIEVLPKVTLNDVPKKGVFYPLSSEKCGNFEVFHHDTFTNDIIYIDVEFPISQIAEDDLPLLRLFSHLASQMACGGRDYKGHLEFIEEHTGGVAFGTSLNAQAENYNILKPTLGLEAKALVRKADKLFPLLIDLLTSVDFTDKVRLKELMVKMYTQVEQSLNSKAMKYASHLAQSGLSEASFIQNKFHGINFYWRLKEWTESFDQTSDILIANLQRLQKTLLLNQGAHIVLSCDKKSYEKIKKNKFYGLQDLELKPVEKWKSNYQLVKVESQCRVIASAVAFTSLALPTVPYTHPDSPALSIAANLFRNNTLHKRIREQGGAYGSGAGNNASTGAFHFYGYRDPHITSTLAAFNEAVENVLSGKYEDRELEEAKLGIVQGMDSPVSPGSRGGVSYAWEMVGKTRDVRQNFRERTLSLTRKDLTKAVEKHLKGKVDQATVVVFTAKELAERENVALEKLARGALKIETI